MRTSLWRRFRITTLSALNRGSRYSSLCGALEAPAAEYESIVQALPFSLAELLAVLVCAVACARLQLRGGTSTSCHCQPSQQVAAKSAAEASTIESRRVLCPSLPPQIFIPDGAGDSATEIDYGSTNDGLAVRIIKATNVPSFFKHTGQIQHTETSIKVELFTKADDKESTLVQRKTTSLPDGVGTDWDEVLYFGMISAEPGALNVRFI
eukprot:2663834-Amphidinium_carterae.1